MQQRLQRIHLQHLFLKNNKKPDCRLTLPLKNT
ncbi:hypothetical protein PsyrH_12545 [Pseudomonas syringae pv. syringae HS191]|uniref:Uncharacterized protein n=1 Tax=Pseudomonas cerasi TaxID=1583341 RepID=A0A193SPM1_9PSED|nr:hypothetical protein PsyrH_12545 [Pseudomonas syringae pv. syringae HS191]CZT28975.1 hypothetical protein PCPL58_2519 [Pseudomonas cerasi]SOS20365.1 hypothetical protein PL963_02574 [Pseudomonas cerasi]